MAFKYLVSKQEPHILVKVIAYAKGDDPDYFHCYVYSTWMPSEMRFRRGDHKVIMKYPKKSWARKSKEKLLEMDNFKHFMFMDDEHHMYK